MISQSVEPKARRLPFEPRIVSYRYSDTLLSSLRKAGFRQVVREVHWSDGADSDGCIAARSARLVSP